MRSVRILALESSGMTPMRSGKIKAKRSRHPRVKRSGACIPENRGHACRKVRGGSGDETIAGGFEKSDRRNSENGDAGASTTKR